MLKEDLEQVVSKLYHQCQALSNENGEPQKEIQVQQQQLTAASNQAVDFAKKQAIAALATLEHFRITKFT